MDTLLLIARLALAAVFVVAGVAKLLDLPGSRQAIQNFGVPERFAKPGGVLLPIAEITIGLLLLPVTTAVYAAIAAALLMLLFIGAIAYNLSRGNSPDCHCFGQLHSAPAGPTTLARNGVFAAVALFIVIAGWDDAGTSLVGWADDMSGFEWLVLALGIVLLAGLIVEGWLIVHMLGQNGRLLLKVDELEERLGQIGQGGLAAAAAAPKPANAQPARGLPVGSPAPAFKLEGIHGETMTLDALRAMGKPVMLVFSDPGCGPCNALMPDVAKWQQEHAGAFTTAVVSRGKAEANQEKAEKSGLNLVFLQKDREVSEAYKALGTPSAVLVNRDGTIGSPVEGGAERIRELVRTLTGAAAQAPKAVLPVAAAPVGNGQGRPGGAAANGGARQPAPAKLEVGADAPDLQLEDLSGKPVALSDFKGQETVLIFWSPTCGFCKRMADDITAWEKDKPKKAPRAVIITSGDPELNRAFGFASPVLMDQQTSAMKAYGTSGTPTAIKIDRNGKVASDVRVGQPGVMSLLKNEPAPAAPAAPPAPKSLQIGEPAPAVKLADIDGKPFDLATLKGQKAAVVFWNPGCGFCKRMVDDLKAWEAQRPADAPQIVLVSTGTVEANKEMGLSSTLLIDQGFQVGRSFGASGTPSAVLIDEDGRIASGVAVGAPRVLELAGAPQPVQ